LVLAAASRAGISQAIGNKLLLRHGAGRKWSREEKMIGNWSGWKNFPNAERGEHVQAPIGPGIYEVRSMSTGDLIAFDAAANVAHALSALLRKQPARRWTRLFGGKPDAWRGADLEYRTCAASSLSEARMMVQALLGRRQVFWRRSAPQANLAGSI
jgi:hypothetical protein